MRNTAIRTIALVALAFANAGTIKINAASALGQLVAPFVDSATSEEQPTVHHCFTDKGLIKPCPGEMVYNIAITQPGGMTHGPECIMHQVTGTLPAGKTVNDLPKAILRGRAADLGWSRLMRAYAHKSCQQLGYTEQEDDFIQNYNDLPDPFGAPEWYDGKMVDLSASGWVNAQFVNVMASETTGKCARPYQGCDPGGSGFKKIECCPGSECIEQAGSGQGQGYICL